jgi:prolyl-tRNA editing enzyme YbaK/EbsC (Cys-tRNA(Pro) deacylase)
LNKEKIKYELIKVPLVHTANETAKAIGCKLELILKSMLIYDYNNPNKISLFVIQGDKKLDFQKINTICGYENAKFFPIDKIFKKTGFEIGTLPPFGYSSDILIYYDRDILKQEFVYAGSGNQKYLIKFNPNNLNKSLFVELN